VDFATSWAAPPQAAPAEPAIDLALLLAGVWAAGVLCFLGLMLVQQWRTLRVLKLGLQPDAIKRAQGNFGPAVVGVLRPLLVVPADFEQRFSPSEQDLVLAHEREHLAAGHTRINAALVVLTSLNWFNPLVHWAARLARVDQELACDAAVLERFPARRGVYAEAPFKAQISQAPLPLGCTWPSRSSRFIKERMTMLASKTPGRARRMAGAAFIAVALLGAGCAAWAQKSPAPAFVDAKVNVSKEGVVTWEGKVLDADAFRAQAKAQAASSTPNIQISADPATPYNKVGKVFQEAQKVGMMSFKFMPSGVLMDTPRPPPPGMPPPGTKPPPPPPPVSQLAIIERAKPDPQGTPKSTAPPVPLPFPIPEPLRVFVDFDNKLYLEVHGARNAKPMDIPALEQAFRENAALKAPPEVHIEPHRLASYAAVEQVIAMADRSGLRLIGVIGGT
jgi:biopolymer transport protein ExbD